MEEMLDLFDAKGQPAGVTIRRGESAPAGMYWAVVDVWVVNAKGEVLIQQRSANKPNWPLYWCESAGGAVQSGEEPDAAALRETQEEIGLTPDFVHGSKIFEFVGNTALHHVYLFCQEADPAALSLQADEVAAVRFTAPAELPRMVREGQMVPIGYLDQLLRMLPILTSMYRKADL